MSTATDTAVTTSVVVDVTQDLAFRVFTDEIGTWWNPEHHLLPEGTSLKAMIFEPRVELEHRHLDRHGDGWEQMRAAVGSDDGWLRGLRLYAGTVAAR